MKTKSLARGCLDVGYLLLSIYALLYVVVPVVNHPMFAEFGELMIILSVN